VRFTVAFDDPLDPRPQQPPARSMLKELRRRMAKRLAQLRLSGASELEVRIAEEVTRAKSLKEIAQVVGVSRQRVHQYIQRFEDRAPFFWRCYLIALSRASGRLTTPSL
jgi:DNA-directed RNA polymerase sigma subunit (sigma70/sigma32)